MYYQVCFFLDYVEPFLALTVSKQITFFLGIILVVYLGDLPCLSTKLKIILEKNFCLLVYVN